jgi:5S rRNA maturation endonuclease (ribonuclease M5)
VRGYDFKTATKWLSDEFGSEKAIATYAVVATLQAKAVIEKTPSPSKVPEPVEQNWGHVRAWLTEIRKLPEAIVDGLHEIGRVFADRFKNAVFASKDGQSAEVVGTSLTPFKGKRGQKESMFSVGKLGKIAVCESAIDAISVMRSGEFTGAISTAGTPSESQYKALKALESEVVIAYDNDEHGNEFAKEAKKHGFYKRVKPINKDWNDDLRANVQADIKSQLETQEPKIKKQSRGMEMG